MHRTAICSVSFYVAMCLAALLLAFLKTIILFKFAFWRFLPIWIRFDAGQALFVGLIASALFALYLVWLNPRPTTLKITIAFGAWCGAGTYVLAYMITLLGSVRWHYAFVFQRWELSAMAILFGPLLMLWIGKALKKF